MSTASKQSNRSALPADVRCRHIVERAPVVLGGNDADPIDLPAVAMLKSWSAIGTRQHGRTEAIRAVGRSMAPVIQDGDLVFLDVGCRRIEAPGIYAFDVAGRLLLKRALILSNGTLILKSENQAEFPDEERYDLAADGCVLTVRGLVVAYAALRGM
jgi:phage repressor protein C with HTH and peptisase S24 domain